MRKLYSVINAVQDTAQPPSTHSCWTLLGHGCGGVGGALLSESNVPVAKLAWQFQLNRYSVFSRRKCVEVNKRKYENSYDKSNNVWTINQSSAIKIE